MGFLQNCIVPIFCLLALALAHPRHDDYCNLKCLIPDSPQTGCKTMCRRASGCTDYATGIRRTYIEEHNRLRELIASGKQTSPKFGPASNMMVLNYDAGLEYVARCLSGTCIMNHDKCRSTPKFEHPGQNLYMSAGLDKLNAHKEAVQTWYSEIEKATQDNIDKMPQMYMEIGHFTQAVWAAATHVGCAMSYTNISGGNTLMQYLYCNYGSTLVYYGGNMPDEPVFLTGDAASKCPKGHLPNSQYPSLCGVLEAVPEGAGSISAWTIVALLGFALVPRLL